MLLFESILENGNTDALRQIKRRPPRYHLGGNFPFKTKLTLYPPGGKKSTRKKGKDWNATPINLSLTGASVQLSLAVVAFPHEACCLKFSRDDYLLEIPGTIAHFRACSNHSLCGIVFDFSTLGLRQAYQQLLEPVSIGHSLVPVETEQDSPYRYRQQFSGKDATRLSVWRDLSDGRITGFDLRMHRYVVRWTEGLPELEVGGLDEAHVGVPPNVTTPLVVLTVAQHEEVRRLFSLTVPNFSKAISEDVRDFFAALAG